MKEKWTKKEIFVAVIIFFPVMLSVFTEWVADRLVDFVKFLDKNVSTKVADYLKKKLKI